jgi:hypothetical protein
MFSLVFEFKIFQYIDLPCTIEKKKRRRKVVIRPQSDEQLDA